MKLDKTIDYVHKDTITAQKLNKGNSCFVIYYGYYTEQRYVRLFARAFDFERAKEAFEVYESLKSEIEHACTIAVNARNVYFRKNAHEVLT